MSPLAAAERHLTLDQLEEMQLQHGVLDSKHSLQNRLNLVKNTTVSNEEDLQSSCTEQASIYDATDVLRVSA